MKIYVYNNLFKEKHKYNINYDIKINIKIKKIEYFLKINYYGLKFINKIMELNSIFK